MLNTGPVLMLLNRNTFYYELEDKGGFTPAEAMAIYHEHIAPLDVIARGDYMDRIKGCLIRKDSEEGRLLLETARGWL